MPFFFFLAKNKDYVNNTKNFCFQLSPSNFSQNIPQVPFEDKEGTVHPPHLVHSPTSL